MAQVITDPALHQQGTIDIKDDPQVIEFLKHADALQGFKSLHKAWLMDNEETWHSGEISKSLICVNDALNNLASYISTAHEDVEIQIELDPDFAKGKALPTLIKRTDEWKALKKYLKQTHSFENQTLTVRGLIYIAIRYAKEFVCKV